MESYVFRHILASGYFQLLSYTLDRSLPAIKLKYLYLFWISRLIFCDSNSQYFWNRGQVVVWGFIHVCQNGNILECRRILEEDYTKMDCVVSMHRLGGLGFCLTITTAGSRNHTGVISRPIFKVDTNWQVTAIFLICVNSVSDFLKVFIRDNCENSQINWSECWPSSNIMISCLQQTVFNPALCLKIKSILSTQNSSRLPFCRPFLSGKG